MAWTLGFVGAGVMAEVMITGLLEEGVLPPAQILASDRRQARLDELATGHHVRVTTDNREVAEAADVLVLAVKPQNLPDVLPELRGALRPGAAALSIIAGARLTTLTEGLGHRAVARCMPNLPCRIRRGMTVWTTAPGFPELDRVRQILRVMGEEVFVDDEQHVDRATAVSGTGPAVVAEFVKALFEAAVFVGQPRDVAHDTVLATVIGTAEMIRRGGADGVHVAQLIDEVTSPGGTTSRALHALKKGHFQATVTDAVDAAYQRTVELGRPARG